MKYSHVFSTTYAIYCSNAVVWLSSLLLYWVSHSFLPIAPDASLRCHRHVLFSRSTFVFFTSSQSTLFYVVSSFRPLSSYYCPLCLKITARFVAFLNFSSFSVPVTARRQSFDFPLGLIRQYALFLFYCWFHLTRVYSLPFLTVLLLAYFLTPQNFKSKNKKGVAFIMDLFSTPSYLSFPFQGGFLLL